MTHLSAVHAAWKFREVDREASQQVELAMVEDDSVAAAVADIAQSDEESRS